ncbi:SgcJ/EcaC family oxidoreductase [Lysobacter sp. K5869]|uniref:YybH family protein n=1 Tax=Lysobacter sp. K5869 TaxID=2820808 RepID=UPI001C062C7D|nr:SgcJ/EcaC family oxidoreductase [Lysobacter sp. K5869]QWP75902.1 SgcJ/EcaC family oxidoreductase [Lysobacter sp. K5869]
MKIHNPTGLLAVAVLALLPLAAIAADAPFGNRDQTAIKRQLDRYEQALNSSDIDAVMQLYAADAVFMPQHSQPAVGRDEVRTAYRKVFGAIRLDIDFNIDEIRVLSRDWAYARTRSNGTVKVLASEQPPVPEANQEIFLLHRESDGQWRFARYIFSTTNPPKKP